MRRRVLAERPRELELFAAIVAETRDILRQRYEIPLLVILWSRRPEEAEPLRESLRRRGVECVTIRDVIPDFGDGAGFVLSPRDGHPNARAHARIADWLSDWILRRSAP